MGGVANINDREFSQLNRGPLTNFLRCAPKLRPFLGHCGRAQFLEAMSTLRTRKILCKSGHSVFRTRDLEEREEIRMLDFDGCGRIVRELERMDKMRSMTMKLNVPPQVRPNFSLSQSLRRYGKLPAHAPSSSANIRDELLSCHVLPLQFMLPMPFLGVLRAFSFCFLQILSMLPFYGSLLMCIRTKPRLTKTEIFPSASRSLV
jgi:hypothetical protein